MKSVRDVAVDLGLAPVVEQVVHATRKHLYDGPRPDGKRCAVCQRLFGNPAEYVTCRLCAAVVCRRKGTCKGVHGAGHRLAAKKSNHLPDSLVTPTTGLARSEHSRQDGERTPATRRDVLDQPNAEAVAKNDDTTRQEAERRGSQVNDCPGELEVSR